MRSRTPTLRQPHAGEIYRGVGGRRIRITQVRRIEENGPYAIAHEIDSKGAERRGCGPSGVPRSLAFAVRLTWVGDGWALPDWYQLEVENPEART